MTLHQSFGPKQQIVRLQAIYQLPTPAELQIALSQAKEHPKAIIELPFQGAKDAVVIQLFLTKEGAPRWTMYNGPTTDAPVLWTMDSHDTEFIITMIQQAESSAQAAATAAIPEELRPKDPRGGQSAPLSSQPYLSAAPNTAYAPAAPSAAYAPAAPSAYAPAGTAGGAQSVPQPVAPRVPGDKRSLAPVPLDMPSVQATLQQLTDTRSGFLTSGAFLFFLMRENAFFQIGRLPYSLLLFEMGLHAPGSGTVSAMTPETLSEAARRIYSVTGPVNLVGHYGETQYAMLLLRSTRNEALRTASQALDALTSQPIGPAGEWRAVFYAGVATIPEDTEHPGILIAQASYAKDIAIQRATPIMLFADA